MTQNKRGFALPTVLIASVVMLMVLVTAVSATTAVRSALENQRYTELVKSAAEAGVVLAEACLRISENTVTWSDAQPLKPNTDCNGEEQEALSAYIREYDDYRTYFVVGEPQLNGNSEPIEAASQGYVEALRTSTGTAWRVFSGSAVSALSVSGDGTPVGTSIEGYWSAAPEGYLLEDGSAVSRTTYANLFSAIGTTFGSGDGSTTFNLPNSQGRVQVAQNSSDSEFNSLGETGGAKTHAHPLSSSGWARVGFDITDGYFGAEEVAVGSNWGATRRFANGVPNTNTATLYGNGAILDGATDSDSSLQPYIAVNRAIKY